MFENELKKLPETEKVPVLFIGHGSPMNIILKNKFTEQLVELGKSLPKPKAIMVISAHWLTKGTFVTCMEKPELIYDFYGFPEELYKVKYPSPGSPEYADLVKEAVKTTQVNCGDWGLDHASWSILKHMFPNADIPIFEMSIDYRKPTEYHYNLGKELLTLRKKGLLVIGSGNIVHNLRLVDFSDMDAEPYDWSLEFDEWVKSNLINTNHQELIDYQNIGKIANLSVPTNDHYLPMIYAIALQEKNEKLKFVYEGFQNASVSMRAFQIG
jgi:4,5-DOPA dioxygenase extradiol